MRTVNSTTGGKTNHLALSLIQARPLGGQTCGRTGKKGSDKGIDGIKVFVDDNSGKAKRVIVQVKSGHVKSGDIRDLVGTQNTHHRDTESTEKDSSKTSVISVPLW